MSTRTRKERPNTLPAVVAWDKAVQQPAYVPTRTDRLWLLRAVAGEGPRHQEVAQALVNRFLFLRATRPHLYPTLHSLVRAYSQPVNPRWQRGGDKWEAAWERATTEKQRRTLLARHKRRDKYSRMRTFDARTTNAVRKALTVGSVDIPANAVHFAGPGETRKGLQILTRPKGANWMQTSAGAKNWQGYRALQAPPSNSKRALSGWGTGAAGIVLLGLMAAIATKGQR